MAHLSVGCQQEKSLGVPVKPACRKEFLCIWLMNQIQYRLIPVILCRTDDTGGFVQHQDRNRKTLHQSLINPDFIHIRINLPVTLCDSYSVTLCISYSVTPAAWRLLADS